MNRRISNRYPTASDFKLPPLIIGPTILINGRDAGGAAPRRLASFDRVFRFVFFNKQNLRLVLNGTGQSNDTEKRLSTSP